MNPIARSGVCSAGAQLRILALLLLALAAFTACAPAAQQGVAGAPERPASELQRVATSAFHRMELARLETGAYTTNALLDLELPRGIKWTLEEFSEEGYRLRFTDDARPEEIWLVSPAGLVRST